MLIYEGFDIIMLTVTPSSPVALKTRAPKYREGAKMTAEVCMILKVKLACKAINISIFTVSNLNKLSAQIIYSKSMSLQSQYSYLQFCINYTL